MKSKAVKQNRSNQTKSSDNRVLRRHATESTDIGFADNRPEAVGQQGLQQAIDNSPPMVAQRKQLQGMFGAPVQLADDEELPAMMKADPSVSQLADDEELSMLKADPSVSQLVGADNKPMPEAKPPANDTGMPDSLKAGVENLSGIDISDVRVHYNSPKPTQLNALAYTQGTDIHVAPGQEQHLAHEAWHVVQQKEGRVQPTMKMNGTDVNDNKGLENESDVMGAKAMKKGK